MKGFYVVRRARIITESAYRWVSVKFDIWDFLFLKIQIWLKSDKNTDTLHRPYFVKRGQFTKYQFYRRSKKVVPFYKRQML